MERLSLLLRENTCESESGESVCVCVRVHAKEKAHGERYVVCAIEARRV